jgi:glycosyltransferase involved in cell wall biosynthesis
VRWLAFGTFDRGHHPRVAVLLEGLRAAGDEVVEINEPLRIGTAGRVAMLRRPWRLPLGLVELVRSWTHLVRRSRRRPSPPDAVLVGYLGHFDVRLARRLFPRTPIVLDHLVSVAGTARDRGLTGRGGITVRALATVDAGAVRAADVVVVDTEEHAATVPPVAAGKVVVVPVGAGTEWFAHGRYRPRRVAGRPLAVIFVGVFTPLHGTRVLGAALADLVGEDVDVTMVGTGQDYAACRAAAAANPRVRWLDWVAPADLPALVAAHDVSLGIFGDTPKAHAVVPTKVYQGAAAGCAVVTSDTAPQRRTLGAAAVYVPPGDAAALAGSLRRLAHDPQQAVRLGVAAHDHAAARYTPALVVRGLREATARLAVDR